MASTHYHFDSVSLLITHYNRSNSLDRLLNTFKDLNCSFADIIVSDDSSSPEHQQKIEELQKKFSFQFITSNVNKGLGNNINKGQDLVKTPYTLYVQEDFNPTQKFPRILEKSLKILTEKDFDIIRFYAYGKYVYLKEYCEDFSEMLFNFWWPGYKKFYYYSDHPHLRKTNFFEVFGRYAEGHNPEQTEYRMMMSFLRKKGKGLFYNNYKELFDHLNSSNEPSTMERNKLRRSKNPLITIVRNIFRHVKFNINYIFIK